MAIGSCCNTQGLESFILSYIPKYIQNNLNTIHYAFRLTYSLSTSFIMLGSVIKSSNVATLNTIIFLEQRNKVNIVHTTEGRE